MSEEEDSFVILGTSPMPSIESQEQNLFSNDHEKLFSSLSRSATDCIKVELGNNSDKTLEENSPIINSSIEIGESEMCPEKSCKRDENIKSFCSADSSNINSDNLKSGADNGRGSSNQSVSIAVSNASLASSFLLGEVNADVLKASIYSQFPSLGSMEASAEDLLKLQKLISQYVELKSALKKVNTTMSQFYSKALQWKDDMRRMEEKHEEKLQECRKEFQTLRNENVKLKSDLTTKMDEIVMNESLRQEDYDILVQSVSEKSALIENMRAEIKKLQNNMLWSTNGSCEYIGRKEHESVIKDMEQQLSVLLAKNLDLNDVQKQYIDEITWLKTNLIAAEESIKLHQSEINLLKAEKLGNSETFAKSQAERDTIREELTLLREQVSVYRQDFEEERNSRQNLAGEKDQLLQDLRALQQKNQELIEAAQRQCEALEKQKQQAGANTATDYDRNPNQYPSRVSLVVSYSKYSKSVIKYMYECFQIRSFLLFSNN